jgi:hypothetical protein
VVAVTAVLTAVAATLAVLALRLRRPDGGHQEGVAVVPVPARPEARHG